MPLHGYTRMFENMLDHPNVKVLLNCDYREVADDIPYRKMIYSAPVDEFFQLRYGKLPYRSLQFDFQTVNQEWVQPVAVVNYPNEPPPAPLGRDGEGGRAGSPAAPWQEPPVSSRGQRP